MKRVREMHKSPLLVLVIAAARVMLFSETKDALPVNFFSDPSFEKAGVVPGRAGLVHFNPNGVVIWDHSGSNAHTGKGAVMLSNVTLSMGVSALPEKTYAFLLYARAPAKTMLHMQINWKRGNSLVRSDVKDLPVENEWSEIGFANVAVPPETDGVVLHVNAVSKNDVIWIDDILYGDTQGPTLPISEISTVKQSIENVFAEKRSPSGIRPAAKDIFQPFLDASAPEIVKVIYEKRVGEISVKSVLFRSLMVGSRMQDVCAIVGRPVAPGKYPGILWLHGGGGNADLDKVIYWASNGYIALSADTPGIGNPAKCSDSSGPWRDLPYGEGRWNVVPDATASTIFDAVVCGLQSFALLSAQEGVIKDHIGIHGVSWGGYHTTMLAGLLGDRIRAAYSIFGCGFYDRGTTFQKELARMSKQDQEVWLASLDAGRRIKGIAANYFIAAAARDAFFYPPGINATLRAVPGKHNQFFAPVQSHSLAGIDGSDQMPRLYFDHALKGVGYPLPELSLVACTAQADGGKSVFFDVQSSCPIKKAKIYFSMPGSWQDRKWESADAELSGNSRWKAVVPPVVVRSNGAWFLIVSDDRPASAGSLVYDATTEGEGVALIPSQK